MQVRKLYRNRIKKNIEPISRYTLEGLLHLSVQLTPKQFHQIHVLRRLGLSEHTIIELYERLLRIKGKIREKKR